VSRKAYKARSIKFDPEFRFLLAVDPAFEEWRVLAAEWFSTFANTHVARHTLPKFFIQYLHGLHLDKRPAALLATNFAAPSLWDALDLKSLTEQTGNTYYDSISDFITWVLQEKFSKVDSAGVHSLPSHLRNPFPRKKNRLLFTKFDPEFRFLLAVDPAFEEWRVLAAEWCSTSTPRKFTQSALPRFFIQYLHGLQLDKRPAALLATNFAAPSLWDALDLKSLTEQTGNNYYDTISDFITWALQEKFSKVDSAGVRSLPSHLRNPFPRKKNRLLFTKFDPEFRFLLAVDPAFEEWRVLAAEWFSTYSNTHMTRHTLPKFFIQYLHGLQLDKRPAALLATSFATPSLWDALDLKSLAGKKGDNYHDNISDFIAWVLREKFSETDSAGVRSLPSHLRNPFPRKVEKQYSKSSDIKFNYILEHDLRMEAWRAIAVEWWSTQRANSNGKRIALDLFLVSYVLRHNLERNPYSFLRRDYEKPDFIDSLVRGKDQGSGIDRSSRPSALTSFIKPNNIIHEFLAWVLTDKLSVEDDNGQRVVPHEFHNPVPPRYGRKARQTETLKTPLPYRYIRELRSMLAQGDNFSKWTWSQQAYDSNYGGDWFVIDPSLVNRNDPDCVWRMRPATKTKYGYTSEVVELWSPVRAVALYLKLELPLRTFQVRMLDSGEADTWRYESAAWRLNTSPLATGSERRPSQRGVFHRSPSEAGAGFYINTNKTADINKDEQNKGYVIPWTHEPALRWLEKLRNWQENYNPITEPTPWRNLEAKHFGYTPPHPDILNERGACSFLFRDAASSGVDRTKPISSGGIQQYWYRLLAELEKRCAARGETLDDGSPIVFTYPNSLAGTYHPLHALRVSLITAYALDGGVPFPILSKLIAGHARLIMTLYYTKAGKAHVSEIMQDADKRMLEHEAASSRRFLMEKTYDNIKESFAFNSPDALNAVSQQKSAASFQFQDKGICPVGGGLCDIGGEEVTKKGEESLYAPVSGYPQERNCVRCRFFLTGPAFIPGLQAHANSVSYRVTECAERYARFEMQVKALEDMRLACEERGSLFTQHEELERLSHYYEEEAEKGNKLMIDLQSTVRLMGRCIAIANSTEKDGVHLVAAGTLTDFQYALYETKSEMHQLEVICEEAVIYPEIDAGKATLRRSQILDAMLQMNGRPPVFFGLTTDQQLRVGNELMKLIRARTGNLKSAVEFAEGRRQLAEIGLFEEAVSLIEEATAGIAIRPWINAAKPKALLADDTTKEQPHYGS